MRKILITAIISFCANVSNAETIKCPSIEVILSGGLNQVARVMDDYPYWNGAKDKFLYDNKEWSFSVGPVESDNENDALKKLTESLKTLKYRGVMKEDGHAMCFYNVIIDGKTQDAVANNPPLGSYS